MGHDFSRISHDPWNDYLGVLLQQGRPLTDADWNAFVAEITRRVQAQTLDTFGAAIVPLQTPDAFQIVPYETVFTIGVGRMYVDGLLIENHGTDPRHWEQQLAELRGTEPIVATSQPYYPVMFALPTDKPSLVYVDVFQREVGPLQDPNLVEKALGVDTTVRLQTVWQVRVLEEVSETARCATVLDKNLAWSRLTAPSAGRLTTWTREVPGEPNPCLVPPGGGYKGSENQLYRVEVHNPGALGDASFKWSRDNASVQASIVRVPDETHLVLDSLGRDEVLRFKAGNWIEIIDDWMELVSGNGFMRRIAVEGVDDATRTLTLTEALSLADLPVDPDGNVRGNTHLRIRRWDQSDLVKREDGTEYPDVDPSSGLIRIPNDGTKLLLEDGVMVSFSVTEEGEGFRTGDYWTFAARASDASVEKLEAAPPQGIHHHYAKLAVVVPAEDGSVSIEDCRKFWPPASCCTVVVRPGEDIQAAIDSLPSDGGCVCLKTGQHYIHSTLRIGNQSNVVLQGESLGASITANDDVFVMLDVDGASDVTVERIHFKLIINAPADTLYSMVAIHDSLGVRVMDCVLHYYDEPLAGHAAGVSCFDSDRVEIRGNRFEQCEFGVLSQGESGTLDVLENAMIGSPQQMCTGLFVDNTADFTFQRNVLDEILTGVVALSGTSDAALIADNVIRRQPPHEAPTELPKVDAVAFAIHVARSGSVVRRNTIDVPSLAHGGIRASGDRCEIDDNLLVGGKTSGYGIYVGESKEVEGIAAHHARVRRNICRGGTSISTLGLVEGRVVGNTLEGATEVLASINATECEHTEIAWNKIDGSDVGIAVGRGTHNRIAQNTVTSSRIGMTIVTDGVVQVDGNQIEDIRSVALALSGPDVRLVNNRFSHCAYEAGTFVVFYQATPSTTCSVICESCEILDPGVSPSRDVVAASVFCFVFGQPTKCRVAQCRVSSQQNDKLAPANVVALAIGARRAAEDQQNDSMAFVTGNTFTGLSQVALVTIAPTEDGDLERLTFSNNHCISRDLREAGFVVNLLANRQIVMGNHVTAGAARAINLNQRPTTLVGNVVDGAIAGAVSGTTKPWPPDVYNDMF
jgi:nitrous oxidase accessory protein NosD